MSKGELSPDLTGILGYWGKASPLPERPQPDWHPLVFHSLDVAAVGERLLHLHGGLRRRLAELLGLEEAAVIRLLACLLALHDLGKFAAGFQAKVPELCERLRGNAPSSIAPGFDHGAAGLKLFDDPRYAATFAGGGEAQEALRHLVLAVCGHHGSPPKPELYGKPTKDVFGVLGLAAAVCFAGEMWALLLGTSGWPPLASAAACRASFAVAGLAVLADWIGSNQHWFAYRRPDDCADLASYLVQARANADVAIREAGILPAPAAPLMSFAALTGKSFQPSPMQRWAATVELPPGPFLALIEDEPGSGKTEAALMLAHRLMAAGCADGTHILLPTMATANAMFDRLAEMHLRLFAPGSRPSLALAHGARDLHPKFREVRLPESGAGERYGIGSEASDEAASAACAAWIADDRRRCFLADVGVGTIDQALLGVLPSRYQSLRLFGLMRRVLILDEVHAYDDYMQREIEALLEFQAAQGGSVVLLSATLPSGMRRNLAAAFARGLGVVHKSSDEAGYPLATLVSAAGCVATGTDGRRDRERRLPVRFLETPQAAIEAVIAAARAGMAVAYIRNSVDDAMEAHAAIAAARLDKPPMLFHARFALSDRLGREGQVLATFGPDSKPGDRAGQVLVATQVVEQSLDLDFDRLVTDLAPIDLLIQRSGRLWRHERAGRPGKPELLVVSPDPVDVPAADWYKRLLPRAAHVYRDHARLWLGARALRDAGAIDSPAGLRALVEAVYGEGAEARIPPALLRSHLDAQGYAGAERGMATGNLLSRFAGYIREGGAWDRDERTPTRLADVPQATLRLGLFRAGRIVPYADPAELRKPGDAWRLSEVSISRLRIEGESLPPDLVPAAEATKRAWHGFDQHKILVALTSATEGKGLRGTAAAPDGNMVEVRYDAARGLGVSAAS